MTVLADFFKNLMRQTAIIVSKAVTPDSGSSNFKKVSQTAIPMQNSNHLFM
jgi:hypothetical protein